MHGRARSYPGFAENMMAKGQCVIATPASLLTIPGVFWCMALGSVIFMEIICGYWFSLVASQPTMEAPLIVRTSYDVCSCWLQFEELRRKIASCGV